MEVLDQEMAVDPDYYIDQQLKLPVLRLFENVLDDAEKQIFSGDHTRKVSWIAFQGSFEGFGSRICNHLLYGVLA